MEQSLVSIIIPVFNAEATLRATIESVLHQSYKNIELIIIDGGSTDGSVEMIESYQTSISYFSSETDKGVYDAMNKGLDHAKGTWIYILGADDVLDSNNVIEIMMHQKLNDAQLLFGNVIHVEKEHSLVPYHHKSSFGWKLLLRNTLHQQAAFYHKSLFSSVKFKTEFRILSDYAFHLKLWRTGIRFVYVDKTIARCRAQGLSKNFEWPLYAEEIKIKLHPDTHFPAWARPFVRPWAFLKYLLKKTFP